MSEELSNGQFRRRQLPLDWLALGPAGHPTFGTEDEAVSRTVAGHADLATLAVAAFAGKLPRCV